MGKSFFLSLIMVFIATGFSQAFPEIQWLSCSNIAKEKQRSGLKSRNIQKKIVANIQKDIPDGFDFKPMIKDLIGEELQELNAEGQKIGMTAYPFVPKAYILWVWKESGGENESSTLSLGVFRISQEESKVNAIWVMEPLRKIIMPDPPEVFDCTPYSLGDLKNTFGIRTYARGPYAGGGYTEEILWLFADYEGKLLKILRTLMTKSEIIAGEWRKHYRQHFDVQTNVILTPDRHKPIPNLKRTTITTEAEMMYRGKNKLLLKEKNEELLVWDPKKRSYSGE